MADTEKILKEARRKISRYCYEECSAYCCRKGSLNLSEKELSLVAGTKKAEYEAKGLIKRLKNKTYSLNIGSLDMPCPSLDMVNKKCIIHRKRSRPLACRQFPLFVKENWILQSSFCPAVSEGKLYRFTHMLKKRGLKIFDGNFEIEM